jgi:hypothetical protein
VVDVVEKLRYVKQEHVAHQATGMGSADAVLKREASVGRVDGGGGMCTGANKHMMRLRPDLFIYNSLMCRFVHLLTQPQRAHFSTHLSVQVTRTTAMFRYISRLSVGEGIRK